MQTVAANVDKLIEYNHLMAVALRRAKGGSEDEDMYFLKKLGKTAGALGFLCITRKRLEELCGPEDITPSKEERALLFAFRAACGAYRS